MCLGAIYWARPAKIYFACTREDAAAIGFDDQFIYEEMGKDPTLRSMVMTPLLREEGLVVFNAWTLKSDKIKY
jgi:tRNA(Arg) A34 adenosine deaminase TadA